MCRLQSSTDVLFVLTWLLFFDVYYICLSRTSHSIDFCYTISINGKKITKRKIRASKTNFVLNKSCRTCLCRKKWLYTTINLLQFHSTWFYTVNKFILFMIYSFYKGWFLFLLKKERNYTKKTKGWNNGKSFVSSNVIIGKIIPFYRMCSALPPPPPPHLIWMERDTVRVRSSD